MGPCVVSYLGEAATSPAPVAAFSWMEPQPGLPPEQTPCHDEIIAEYDNHDVDRDRSHDVDRNQ
jgi:hypothetical protein